MESSLSAFAMYQKQNKKRKNPPEYKTEHRTTLPTKKVKKNQDKTTKIVKENGHPGLNKETKRIKIHDTKSKIKRWQKNPINGDKSDDEDVKSDDDIPTLVPIVEKRAQLKVEHFTEDVGTNNPDSSNKKIPNKIPKIPEDLKKTLSSRSKKISVSSRIFNTSSVFNPVTQGLAIFKWLVDPVTVKEFFEKYWEKDVLFLQHSNVKYFKDIFSSDKLDSILREYPLYFTRNVDVVAYENGKKEVLNPEGRAVPSQLWDYYNNGCSIRVLNPQTYDQNVHSLISSLQEYFGTMVGANVYLTPPGSQGFAPHFDDIEAFIIQLEGSKHWKLYKPKDEEVLARDSSKNFKQEDIGQPFMEVTVNAGDLLYFPRGTIHEGCTTGDAHSLHITVSVYQHTAYIDLLEQLLPNALKKAASDDIEYRKGLPLNYLKHVGVVNQSKKSKLRDLIINKTKDLVESLVNYLDVDSAADNLGRKFMYDAMPPLLSHEEADNSSKFDGDRMTYGKVLNRVEIDTEVKIRLLRYYAVRVVKENELTSKLYYCTDNAKTYHGEEEQWLEIDNSLIPAFERLQKMYPEFVEVGSLPIEDESAKLQLVSDLWERGLLVTDGPLPRSAFDDDEDDDSDISSEGTDPDTE